MRILASILLGICSLGPARAEVACSRLVFATNPNYPPFSWVEDKTRYQGASIALLQKITLPGVTMEPVIYPWNRAQAMARAGQIDLLLSLRITPEREQYLAFTRSPAFPNPIVVFAREGGPLRTADWKLLEKYRGGVSLGDSFGGGFDAYLKEHLHVEVADTMTENFKKLSLGRVDYFVSGEYLGRAYLRSTRRQGEGRILALSPPVSREFIHFAMSRKSRCLHLLPLIDEKLKELVRQGIPARLLEEALDSMPEASETEPGKPATRPTR
ncbi:substrate-binding periplasmic protein [Niveibacterium terrae]|uniref:substrate-binding periplasmic protein n=1 Tax=Niveibacterium terrae TaxID=3373598 RepID=UPI003A946530